MTSQVRHRRSSNPSTTFPSSLEPGEIAVNTANRQLAVGDANSSTLGAPVVLLALRYFDARAIYATGDLVASGGLIQRALHANGPGAYNSADWFVIAGVTDPLVVLKAGDTMSGNLVLSSGAVVVAPAKGSLFGTNAGTPGAAPVQADANIILYSASAVNWAGVGADANGSMWFRTGASGSPLPALTIDNAQAANFLNIPTHPTPAPADNSLKSATTAFVNTAVGSKSPQAPASAKVLGSDASKLLVAAVAGTDYLAPPAGTKIQKAASGAALTDAVAGTDYCAPTSGSGILKGNGGNTTAAVAGTDYCAATTGSSVLKGNLGNAVAANAGTEYMHPNITSTITIGFSILPHDDGTFATGNLTPDPALSNYHYYTNNGPHGIVAPTVDCAIDILVTNSTAAGAITFSGFQVAAGNVGDPLTTINSNKFIISIRRINGTATYVIKALQ